MQDEVVAAAAGLRALVPIRALSTERAKSCCPGKVASRACGFLMRRLVAAKMESSGVILQIGARRGRRKTACARRRETAAPERRRPPSTPSGRRPSSGRDARCRRWKKQLHVHPVVDLLVVFGLLPRADARDVVAPVGVAGSWIIISSPLRRFIDETHLLLVLICQ